MNFETINEIGSPSIVSATTKTLVDFIGNYFPFSDTIRRSTKTII